MTPALTHITPPRVTWRTHSSLVLLALVYVASFVDRQVVAVLIEPIKREFGASDTAMGLLTGLAFGLLYAGLGVPVGRLADRHDRRRIVAVCCALWSLATAACGMAQQFWQLLAARMAVAIGEAGGMAPSISIVSDLYPPRRRSLVISLFMMGPHLGAFIGLGLGAWIAQQHGWRAAFLAFGLPGLLLAAAVWWWVQEPRRGGFEAASGIGKGMPSPVDAASGPSEGLVAQLRRLLGIVALRRVALACGVAGVVGYGYGIWVPSYLVRSHGLSIAEAGFWFGGASAVGAVAGSLFSGLACDRLTQRDARWQVGLPLLGLAIALPVVVCFLLWPAGGRWTWGALSVPTVVGWAALFGFFASWWPSLSYSAVSQMVSASDRSVAAALLNFFITLFGVGLGPLVTGIASDLLTPRFGQEALRWALLSVMALFALSLLAYGAALGPYRQRLQAMRATPG